MRRSRLMKDINKRHAIALEDLNLASNKDIWLKDFFEMIFNQAAKSIELFAATHRLTLHQRHQTIALAKFSHQSIHLDYNGQNNFTCFAKNC